MATPTAQTHCSQCDEERETYTCRGCSQIFCFEHLTNHREKMKQQLNHIEDHSNSLRQTILDQKNHPNKHSLIEEINQWEKRSLQIIEQTAKQCRERLIKYTKKFLTKIENKLNELSEQLKHIRQKNKFNELDLNQFNQILTKLENELHHSSDVSIQQQQSTSFINKISLIIPLDKVYYLYSDTTWKQLATTIAGGNGDGQQLNQLSYPCNIAMDDDQTLFVADQGNHRIMEWSSNAIKGRIVAGGHRPGNETNQLNQPTDVIVDHGNHSLIIIDRLNRRVMQWSRQYSTEHGEILLSDIDCYGLIMDQKGSLYFSDYKTNEVKRWKRGEKEGTIVAGGNGQGNQLHQLHSPTSLFVDADESLYVSDPRNHRVMKWRKDAKEGTVVAGGNGRGQSLRQLSSPTGVLVDSFGQIYVADCGNHRVMRWCEGAKEGTIVVGGNGQGKQANQLSGPIGLSFDRQGNLYVADFGNHRIQKFVVE